MGLFGVHSPVFMNKGAICGMKLNKFRLLISVNMSKTQILWERMLKKNPLVCFMSRVHINFRNIPQRPSACRQSFRVAEKEGEMDVVLVRGRVGGFACVVFGVAHDFKCEI